MQNMHLKTALHFNAVSNLDNSRFLWIHAEQIKLKQSSTSARALSSLQ